MRTILANAAVGLAAILAGCSVFPPELDPPALPADGTAARPAGSCVAASYGSSVEFNGSEQLGDEVPYDGECNVLGSVDIGPNATAAELAQARALKTIANQLSIHGASKLTVADFPNLTAVAGAIKIDGTNVTKIGFPALTVAGSLQIDNNASLTSIDGFGALTYAADITIRNNGALKTVTGFGKLTSVPGNVQFKDNAALASIGGFGALTTVKWLELIQNTQLTTMTAFSSLAKAAKVSLAGDGLTAFALPKLVNVDHGLQLVEMPALTKVDFGALQKVGDTFVWNTLPVLLNVDMPALTSLADTLVSVNGTGIVSFSAKQLVETAQFAFTNCPALKTMVFPSLKKATIFAITGNDTLDNLNGFDALVAPQGYNVCGNPMVPKAAVDAFQAQHPGGQTCQ